MKVMLEDSLAKLPLSRKAKIAAAMVMNSASGSRAWKETDVGVGCPGYEFLVNLGGEPQCPQELIYKASGSIQVAATSDDDYCRIFDVTTAEFLPSRDSMKATTLAILLTQKGSNRDLLAQVDLLTAENLTLQSEVTRRAELHMIDREKLEQENTAMLDALTATRNKLVQVREQLREARQVAHSITEGVTSFKG